MVMVLIAQIVPIPLAPTPMVREDNGDVNGLPC